MQNFEFAKLNSAEELSQLVKSGRFLAGGTTLIDLMKLYVETPTQVLDVNALPYHDIKEENDHFLIGALVRNSELAHHEKIKKKLPVLSQALLAGASVQLRNKATTGGNLLQRTRCVYFRDASKPCNKRVPGSGCPAIAGFNRNLAILGTSEACIANNPSDMNVAMMALGAEVQVKGTQGERSIPVQGFYTLPGSTPHIENTLLPGEFITGVKIKKLSSSAKSLYVKLRDRQSYEFALASVAVIADVVGGRFANLQIAMGGIGAIPWRCKEAETFLLGKAPSLSNFTEAAMLTLANARPQSQNAFKVELTKRAFIHALQEVIK